ncbi:hypothetical protein, partial [Prevotella sp.]|uniref:hypothetical protein n=1 Tax=Prevotella sp. TaxID=59823 RepID=UPI0027E24163
KFGLRPKLTEVSGHMYKLLKIKHLSVRSALPLAIARTSIHRRWINYFLTSSNSYFAHPLFFAPKPHTRGDK